MAIPALTVPITADDSVFRTAVARSQSSILGFSSTVQKAVDDADRRMQAMGGNLGQKLDFNRAAASNAKSARDSASAFEELLSEREAVARSAAALRAQIDPLGAAQLRLNNAIAEHGKLAAIGAISTAEQAAANGLAQRAFAESEKTIATHTKAVNDNAQGHGGNNIAMLEATHIVKSLGEQFAAGVDPIRAFTLEGGRIVTLFQYGGGVSGVLSTVGSMVAKLANPFVLGAAAVVGFGGAALYALSSYRSLQDEMSRSVMGVGRFAGLSAQGVSGLAATSGRQTGLGYVQSAQNASALTATGKLDASNIAGVLGLTRGYAGAFQTDYTEAGSKLADIFSDPAKGADELDKRLGFLDDRTRQYIRTLQAQGDQQGAVKALIDASSTSLNEQAEKLGFWAQTWQNVKNGAVAVGAEFSGPTPQQQYNRASASGGVGLIGALQGRGLYDDGTSNIAEDFRHQGMLAGASPIMRSQQDDVIANRQSREGGDVVRSVLPDITRLQDMVDQQKKLSDAINNPDALKLMGATADQTHDALDRLNVGIATFKTNAQQIAQESAFAVAGIQAETFAQKTAVDYLRTYTETLERTHSALDAATAAEGKRNEAIATANKNAKDAAREQSQSNALLGLRPAQRLEVERQQAIENARRESFYPAANSNVPPTTYSSAPLAGSVGVGAGPVTPAQLRAFQLLTSAGYSPAAAAGFVGGLTGESGSNLNPAAVNPTSGALGVAQDLGARQAGMLAQPNAMTLDSQVAYAIAELHGGGAPGRAGAMLSNATTVQGGLEANHVFEGMSDKEWQDSQARRLMAGDNLLSYVQANGTQGPGASPNASPVTSTAFSTLSASANDNYAKQLAELQAAPLRSANDDLKNQAALLETQAEMFGKSASAIKGAIAAQELWNQYVKDGLAPAGALSSQTGALADSVRAVGATTAAQAKQADDLQKRQQQSTGALDDVRGYSNDLLGSTVTAFAHHRNVGDAARQAMSSIGDSLIQKGVGGITSGLFGGRGQPGGGLFGSALGGLFGGGSSSPSSSSDAGLGSLLGGVFNFLPHFAGGTNDAPGGPSLVGEKGPEIVNLPQHSQVVPNGAAFGKGAPNVTVGGHQIIIQGNADKDTAAMIDQKIAAANAQQYQRITRDLQNMNSTNQQYAA